MKIQLSSFDLDMVMAARYAYYVKTTPIMPDKAYDKLEREYEMIHGKLPVGSDQMKDYTDAQRALALYFLMSGRFIPIQSKYL